MANAIEKTNNATAEKKNSAKQLRLPPLAIGTLSKVLAIVDAVKNGAAVEGVVDVKTANKAMGVKVNAPCLMGVVTNYHGKNRAFTLKARFAGEVVEYTISTTGNKDVSYLIDAGKDGEAARGYEESYLKRLKVLVETGSLIPALSYYGQIRQRSFDVLGAFFKKEFATFGKLFGKDKLSELEVLMDAEATFSFTYQNCEDAIKYREYLQEIIANENGRYAPEFVAKASDKLTEINGANTAGNVV